ncbi:MAG: hypothetical protein MOGMAGMI_00861 [Candidatus Omnitrophica bacterium]|nr:hypothetical protein [Candidatus Omnitrophota bacterium]
MIARDERRVIAERLSELAFCDERVVLDGGSTDGTAQAATAAGAIVEVRPFTDFADQRNHALSIARGKWVFIVDCDEPVGPELAAEVLRAVRSDRYDAYEVRRVNRIFGRTMRYGGNGGDVQVRLALRDRARFEGRVHERLVTSGLRVGRLRAPLVHESTPDVRTYMRKLNHYTALEVQEMRRRGTDGIGRGDAPRAGRALAVFVRRYFLAGGLLDGMPGFLYAMLSGYYEFVRRMKVWEERGASIERSAE